MSDSVKMTADLRLPFAPAQIGHLPRGGVTLEYVGHGAVTSRLLDVDPEWNWEPAALEDGRPVFELDDQGNPVGFWIRLTVGTVTRWGFGSCLSSQFEAEKVLIGDAIRNAAMRFGVALDLWVKGHAEDDERVSGDDTRTRARRGGSGSAGKGRQGPPVCALCDKPTSEGGPVVQGEGGYVHKACLDADEAKGSGPEVTADNAGSSGTAAPAPQITEEPAA